MDPEGLNEPGHACGILKEETNKQNKTNSGTQTTGRRVKGRLNICDGGGGVGAEQLWGVQTWN